VNSPALTRTVSMATTLRSMDSRDWAPEAAVLAASVVHACPTCNGKRNWSRCGS